MEWYRSVDPALVVQLSARFMTRVVRCRARCGRGNFLLPAVITAGFPKVPLRGGYNFGIEHIHLPDFLLEDK